MIHDAGTHGAAAEVVDDGIDADEAGGASAASVPSWIGAAPGGPDASSDTDLSALADMVVRRDVVVRLIGLGYANLPIGLVTDLICVITMTWMIAGFVDSTGLVVWVALAAAHMVARVLVWVGWRAAAPRRRKKVAWRLMFVLQAASMAALWAVAGTVFMHVVPPGQQIFLIALLLGVSAALMASVAPEPAAAYLSFAVLGLPVATGFLVSGQAHFQALGVLCIVYAGFMSIMARSYHNLLLRSVTSEIEKSALADRYRAARIRAEKASDAKSRFLANMSHELRTPLNAINGFSEMMKDGVVRPAAIERYQSYAELIHRSGTHLLDLINDVLDLAKAEAGQHELNEEAVDVIALAGECIDEMQPTADRAGVLLIDEVRYSTALPAGCETIELWADRRKLRQILLNLLSNALKFTPEDGLVVISCGLPGDGGFVLYVRDTGVGMSRAQVAEAMKPFTQVDEGYDKRYQGTGLGLPLSKTLVELHGGTLRLDSERGSGTTACLWLPEARTNLPEIAGKPEEAT